MNQTVSKWIVTDVYERTRYFAVFIIIIYKTHIHPDYFQP